MVRHELKENMYLGAVMWVRDVDTSIVSPSVYISTSSAGGLQGLIFLSTASQCDSSRQIVISS